MAAHVSSAPSAVARPPVDVVIPFRGDLKQLAQLRERLGQLRLAEGDSLLVVDNTPGREPLAEGSLLRDAQIPSPAYARNRGAARGSAAWIAFLDADVVPFPDLLDRLFEPPPGERTALLAGGVRDEEVPPDGPPAARYAYLRAAMSQDDSMRPGDRWGYPKTANAAFRRSAFEEVGGFREELRAGEDADLAYRLRAAGWEIERREGAAVVHHNRLTLRAYLAQKAVHGAGAAWLDRHHPGSVAPRRRLPGLTLWGLRTAARGLARARNRDAALWAVMEPLELIAWEVGRRLSNERAPR